MAALERRVIAEIVLMEDLHLRASRIVSPSGKQYVEMREYVPSLNRYSRGLSIPANSLRDLEFLISALVNNP